MRFGFSRYNCISVYLTVTELAVVSSINISNRCSIELAPLEFDGASFLACFKEFTYRMPLLLQSFDWQANEI